MKTLTTLVATISLLVWFISPVAYADHFVKKNLAFPGAKGFGQYSQGGKGGDVYIVNTLADDPKNPLKGSLRYALKRKHPRTIVFSVSGVIHLKSPIIIKSGYLTIAGQSSPGGITIAGAPIKVSNTEHIIIRYMRFRLGTFGLAEDAMSVRDSSDVIIDHCSFSWAVDEVASFYNNTRFTLQHSIIAYSLNDSIHPKGKHGYGGIWGGNEASFLNNVIANHNSRTPRLNGHRLKPPYPQKFEFVEMANNVIYNWGSNNIYGSENGRFNLINNYYIPGKNSKAKQFIDLWYSPQLSKQQAYIKGNFYYSAAELTKNNHLGVMYRLAKKAKKKVISASNPLLSQTPLVPFQHPDYINHFESAEVSYKQLIDSHNVGANRNANGVFIDNIDQLILQQISTEKQQPQAKLINHEFELIKSWVDYQKQFTAFPNIKDKNQDGINDTWALSPQKNAKNIYRYLNSLTK
ncbi:hypothetical protein Q4493_11605 [Colwellia sp. 1_MG-2023]|uniref:pectate lyase family protein n=1 Tax=Colwellia sp. 1_MG-2023 TaxID=3062649 RepID=UPI0026E278DE|nr:hypothetical protein [Colwellia sp. 1_MG-2023]MDO6446419.1 hypothetical protein [Colwellia sp. 1_MG-2023]